MEFANVLPTFVRKDAGRSSPAAAMLPMKSGEHKRTETLSEAEERGFQRGLASAREEEEQTREETKLEWEGRLRDERARWLAEEAGPLAEAWNTALRDAVARLSLSAASLLAPLIGEVLASNAADELSAAIRGLLAQEKQPLISVTGAEDLIDAVRARLGDISGAIDFTVADQADVKVVAGDTVIETQLEGWRSRLVEAIGGAANG